MSQRKKVILFIVEGSTDRDALIDVLEQLFAHTIVKFMIMRGDITSERNSTVSNILKILGESIAADMKKYGFRNSDILQVIHIVDTDGAFISPEKVISGSSPYLIYRQDYIECSDPDKIIERNKRKSHILKLLIQTKKIKSFSYSCYYFSRNLEHVLHNKSEELSVDEKYNLADQFQKSYQDHSEDFLRVLSTSDFAVLLEYLESWIFIQKDTNSLKRYSNFHLALEYLKKICCPF
ncbi:MAG: hypothetical protein RRY13_07420 [Akkermansia sp.]